MIKRTFLLLSLAFAGNAYSQEADGRPFSGLKNLQGTWVIRDYKKPGQSLFEWWTLTNDSTLSGMGFLVPEKDTIVLEIMRISFHHGRLQFEAQDMIGQKEGFVPFTALSGEGERTTFENRQHDFPQRIIYEWPLNGAFRAAIEGEKNGKTVRQEYHFRKLE